MWANLATEPPWYQATKWCPDRKRPSKNNLLSELTKLIAKANSSSPTYKKNVLTDSHDTDFRPWFIEQFEA